MISPGRIAYALYHRPVAAVKRTLRTGIRNSIAIHRGRKEMMEAATRLQEIVYATSETHTVYFLTGRKYWYQTAFCLYSLQRHAGCNIQAVLVDDGSLDEALIGAVRQQFPTTVMVVTIKEIEEHLNAKLPATRFPTLRQRRLEYPHLRKLTDVHVLPGNGFKLVLDSDMLFFAQPTEMLQWMCQQTGMLFMRDVEQSYGYSDALIKRLTGVDHFPERLNVGIAGINSADIDWAQVEAWTKTMLQLEGSSYLQEQALTAMVAAVNTYNFLDASAYKVLPSIKGSIVPEVLHHYVADSKYDYLVKGWRMVAAGSNTPTAREQKIPKAVAPL